ncbi:MAG: SDR family NAD(P)-dependent oxidoreductase [Pseudomonadota bacterium]
MGRLDDKVTIITGAAGGIGRAAAQRFLAEGSKVMLVDLDASALKATADELGSNAVAWHVADVTQPDDNNAMVASTLDRFGGVDVFLANAGIEGKVAPLLEQDIDTFDRVMAVNVRGVWLGLQSVIPAMRARGGGSIVITSSVAGLKGAGSLAPYVTSKHAVIGLMKSAALDCAPHNIRVNTVNPSPVNTRMMRSIEEGIAPGAGESAREMMAARIPLGRYGEPDDVARVMLFLASDDASFVTGSVYMADGGNIA